MATKMKNHQDKVALYIPSLIGGGAERVFVNLAEQFVKRGVRVALVVSSSKDGCYSVPDGVEFFDLKSSSMLRSVIPFFCFCRSWKPSAVLSGLTWTNFVAIVAWMLCPTFKVFISEHNSINHWYLKDRDLVSKGLIWRAVTRALIFLLYPFATGCIAVSKGVESEFRRLSPFSSNKWISIGNPVAFSNSEKVTAIDFCGPYILGAGALVHQKGFEFLVRSFKVVLNSFPELRLVIVGEGPLRSELESLAQELGIAESVHFPGFVSNVGAYYASAKLFALSSVAEGFGNVLVEAMSFGVPVVSTDCPHGPREILDGGVYGRLVPPGDSDALADAIVSTLRDAVDSNRLVERADEFSPDRVSSRYLNCIL